MHLLNDYTNLLKIKTRFPSFIHNDCANYPYFATNSRQDQLISPHCTCRIGYVLNSAYLILHNLSLSQSYRITYTMQRSTRKYGLSTTIIFIQR